MPWVNYHSHSLFCDGIASPEEFIKVALDRGFHAFGCSSHAPVPFPSRWNMDPGRLQEYLNEVSRLKSVYQGRIEVYAGLEVDFIDGYWGYQRSELKNKGLDYSVGSVHYIRQFPDGSYFCFDGQPEAFFKGIELLYHNNYQKALTEYFQCVRQMVAQDKPDIIGHMDKIKMHNHVRTYFNETDAWYRDQVEETLDLIAQNGSILEVNTRGLYKHNPPMLYPGKWVLEQAYLRKIPVMLNSDAHRPDEIESGFSFAAGILKEIGYNSLRIILNKTWQDMAFNETGILL